MIPVARALTPLVGDRMPRWMFPAIGFGAVALGAVLSALLGFSFAAWAVFSALLFVMCGPLAVGLTEGRRKGKDAFLRYLVWTALLLALVPLVSLLWTVLSRGLPHVSMRMLTTSMGGVTGATDNASAAGTAPAYGGIYHAIVGTLVVTFWAALIAVPIGVLTAVFLTEYGRSGPARWIAKAITFFVDVMTGIPSVVAGLFAVALFTEVDAALGEGFQRRGFVASAALAVLMVPIVVRNTEEMLKVVPDELREAAYALGVRKWRTITQVVIPTAVSGVTSGITLAIARIIGETAPILVTAGFVATINWNPFSGWITTLPTMIYYQIMNPTSPTQATVSEGRAWAAALVLIVIVMVLNLVARFIAKLFEPHTSR